VKPTYTNLEFLDTFLGKTPISNYKEIRPPVEAALTYADGQTDGRTDSQKAGHDEGNK
jgi:hypothetical protein